MKKFGTVLFLSSVLSSIFGMGFMTSAGAATLLPMSAWDQITESRLGSDFDASAFEFDLRYQIGEEWGKKPVTPDQMKTETRAFQRAALATARMGGATAFYLGKFNGHHVMATNHHVLPSARSCLGNFARFPLLDDKKFVCKTFYGEWTDVDLALFEIEVTTPADEALLAPIGRNFNYDGNLVPGQLLLTIGFGIADNPRRVMMANQDSDCKVYSATNDFHFMGDPDEFNPGPYKAWSFANGCDVSHGDSGSAMVDRVTGDPVGLIWTGKIPKNEKVRSKAYLDNLLKTQSPEVWTELSFAVPATKIREHLRGVIDSGKLSPETRATLAAVIGVK